MAIFSSLMPAKRRNRDSDDTSRHDTTGHGRRHGNRGRHNGFTGHGNRHHNFSGNGRGGY